MTKFAKIASVLAVVLALAACSTGAAQSESVSRGDSAFSRAQSK
jgi:ABC-type glycerol-3-phosphate transport system substrate-binding protein